jgi:hypothetical protein
VAISALWWRRQRTPGTVISRYRRGSLRGGASGL